MSYLAVDDIDARVKKAEKAGAKLMKSGIFDVPGVGRIAILIEPGGAGVGWITPAPVEQEPPVMRHAIVSQDEWLAGAQGAAGQGKGIQQAA